VHRLVAPLVLLAVSLAAFYASNRLGNDPEIEPVVDPITAAEVPLLSARRLPEFLTEPLSREELTESLSEVLDDSDDVTNLSCLTVRDNNEELFSRQGNLAYTPASTQKIMTALAALIQLGPSHRFTTAVYADAAPVGGVVENLYLVGGGDPLLMTADYARSFRGLTPDLWTNIDELADNVIGAGVTQINGGVLSISGLYDEQRYPPGWPERYATQGQAGPLGALMINDAFTSWPSTPSEREFADPLGVATTERPGVHAAALFDDLLEARNVIPARGQREADSSVTTENLALITTIESPPLSNVVTEMLRFSDNTTAELLTKHLGLAVSASGSTAAGTNAIKMIIEDEGIAVFETPPADGSGLDPSNRLTCPQLVSMLDYPETRDILAEAMPVAGESGTLANRFVGSTARGNLRAKTGSLLNVTALAGYVTGSDGEPLTFAYIANLGPGQVLPDDFRDLQEPMGDALADYPVAPPVSVVAPPGATALPGGEGSLDLDGSGDGDDSDDAEDDAESGDEADG